MTLAQLMEKLGKACEDTPAKPVCIQVNNMRGLILSICTFQLVPPKGAEKDGPYLTALLPKFFPVTTVNCLRIAIESTLKKYDDMKIEKFNGMDVMIHHSYDNDGVQLATPKVLQVSDASELDPLWFPICA